MIDVCPSYIELEEGETVSLQHETDWVVQEWLDDTKYGGAWVFPPAMPTHAGYWMLPYPAGQGEAPTQ